VGGVASRTGGSAGFRFASGFRVRLNPASASNEAGSVGSASIEGSNAFEQGAGRPPRVIHGRVAQKNKKTLGGRSPSSSCRECVVRHPAGDAPTQNLSGNRLVAARL